MSLIVVMEDDDTLQLLVSTILKKQGHIVYAASNGRRGLDLVRMHKPDVVVSDVQMPDMDGVTMLLTLRSEADITNTPVILLTSLGARPDVRMGMTSGADDYLTKPFLPAELCDAVDAQLARHALRTALQDTAVTTALDTQKEMLSIQYEVRLNNVLSGERWPGQESETDETYENATVLYVDLMGTGLSEVLTVSELTQALRQAFTSASDTLHLFGARHVHPLGEALIAVFVEETDTESVNHSMRAVRSALMLAKSVKQNRSQLEAQHAGKKFPSFSVGVGLHSGAVNITKIHDPMHGSQTIIAPVGDTINVAARLQKQTAALGWAVSCTEAVLEKVSHNVTSGRRFNLRLRENGPIAQAIEITALNLATD
jgi:DNA-binding response OmpR family regulator